MHVACACWDGRGGELCILICERAQLGARRRTSMFRGSVGLYV